MEKRTNFLENKNAVRAFESSTNSKELLFRLSALANSSFIPGETLVFFDEVQECPEIVTAIKFLVEEGSYRYIKRFSVGRGFGRYPLRARGIYGFSRNVSS